MQWRRVGRSLRAHWSLKLAALALATLLWASYVTEPFVEIGIAVPLEFQNVPGDLEISSGTPLEAVVRVRGRATALRRLTSADLGLIFDLRNARAGDLAMACDSSRVSAPFGVTVLRVEPEQVHVKLIPRASATPAR